MRVNVSPSDYDLRRPKDRWKSVGTIGPRSRLVYQSCRSKIRVVLLKDCPESVAKLWTKIRPGSTILIGMFYSVQAWGQL